MNFKRITKISDPMYSKAIELYSTSFPPHEKRSSASQKRILSLSDYHMELIYADSMFVGLMMYWETPTFLYVEHFCIDTIIRGKGYGAKALSLLSTKHIPIILEIDPPIDNISIKRERFYSKAGFLTNQYVHIHPPYIPNNNGHKLSVMSFPQLLDSSTYLQFSFYLKEVVMKDAITNLST